MAIAVGASAPDFSLLDQGGEAHTLSQHKGRNIILAFFPAVFSGVCDTEMCEFRDSISELENANADVIGVSVDVRFANAEFASKHNLPFPILSDYSRSTIKAYDVVWPDFAGMDGYNAATRSVFVIDGDGTVRYAWATEDSQGNQPPYDDVKTAAAKLG
jgi:peroxiredoxin